MSIIAENLCGKRNRADGPSLLARPSQAHSNPETANVDTDGVRNRTDFPLPEASRARTLIEEAGALPDQSFVHWCSPRTAS